MNINEQTDAFLFEMQHVVNKFKQEFDLNHATIIGCIEMVKIDYLVEPTDEVEFNADDEEDNDPF
jgi:hypothetical protein